VFVVDAVEFVCGDHRLARAKENKEVSSSKVSLG
jgi:hypothetical protein